MGMKRNLKVEVIRDENNRPNFNQMMLESTMWLSELILEDTYDDSDDLNIPAPTDIEVEIDSQDSELERKEGPGYILTKEFLNHYSKTGETDMSLLGKVTESSIGGITAIVGSQGTLEKPFPSNVDEDGNISECDLKKLNEDIEYLEEKMNIKEIINSILPLTVGIATGYAAKKLIVDKVKKDKEFKDLTDKYKELELQTGDNSDDISVLVNKIKAKLNENVEVEVKAIGQGGTESTITYVGKNIEDVKPQVIDGMDIPEENIKSMKVIGDTDKKRGYVGDDNSEPIEEDQIPGGKADGMNICDIAKKHNVNKNQIINQVAKGISIEKEHTLDPDKAREIAMDHLEEIPDYYDRLDTMEKEALAEGRIKSADDSPLHPRQAMDYINPDGSITDEGRQAEKDGKIIILDENNTIFDLMLNENFDLIVESSISDKDTELFEYAMDNLTGEEKYYNILMTISTSIDNPKTIKTIEKIMKKSKESIDLNKLDKFIRFEVIKNILSKLDSDKKLLKYEKLIGGKVKRKLELNEYVAIPVNSPEQAIAVFAAYTALSMIILGPLLGAIVGAATIGINVLAQYTIVPMVNSLERKIYQWRRERKRRKSLNEAKTVDIDKNIAKNRSAKMSYSFKDKNKIKNKIKNISTKLKVISKTKFKTFDAIEVDNMDFEELQDIFNLIPGVNEIMFDQDGTLDADDVMKLSLSTRELITVVDEQSFREKQLESSVKKWKKDMGTTEDVSTEFVKMQEDLKDMTTIRFRVDTYIGILTDFVESMKNKINKQKNEK